MAQTACPLKEMHFITAYLRSHILLSAGNILDTPKECIKYTREKYSNPVLLPDKYVTPRSRVLVDTPPP